MPQVDLGSLQVFVRVAELGSISKAAFSLGTSQPTVSRIVSELEQELGGDLFYRTGRGVSLSELGEMILHRARGLINSAQQMTADAQDFGKAPAGNVCVGPSLR